MCTLTQHIDGCQYVVMAPAAATLVETLNACCPPVLEGVLAADEAEQLASALRVVAEPTRLRLLSMLGAAPDGWACQCDLQAGVGLSQPTVSHHLKVLSEAGFVERERRGQWVYYRLVPRALAVLRDVLVPKRKTRR